MKTERVKEGRKSLHEHEDGECEHSPDNENKIEDDGPRIALAAEAKPKHHLPQHLREFCKEKRINNKSINRYCTVGVNLYYGAVTC